MTRSNRLGTVIDQLGDIRAKIRRLEAEQKELTEQRKTLEEEFLNLCEESGMRKASTHAFTASVQETTVPQVTDWDALHAYIVAENKPYLLQRRVTTKAWEEEMNLNGGEPIPGTEPFTQRKVFLRAL
jgi:hypothetical protein